MNEKTSQPPTIRTFVAIELPPAIRALLGNIQEELRESLEESAGAVRWTRVESIHLTLQFLGDIERDRVEPVKQSLVRACHGKSPFSLNLGSLGAFPNPRQARVLWVGLEGDSADMASLRALQGAVSEQLTQAGFRPDKSFMPHLTLGRLREGASRADLAAITNLLAYPEAQPTFAATFEVDTVSLVKSDLLPGGSVYTRLAEVGLGVGNA